MNLLRSFPFLAQRDPILGGGTLWGGSPGGTAPLGPQGPTDENQMKMKTDWLKSFCMCLRLREICL